MGRSFFYGKDADVLAGSTWFAEKILLDPERYGLDQPIAEAYQVLFAAYAETCQRAADPSTRTSTAIIGRNAARRALCVESARLSLLINGTASVTDQDRANLGLSRNVQSTAVTPPGTPTKFRAELTQVGALRVSFACRHPGESRGTIYDVSRQLGGVGPFVHIGMSGKKRFIDGDIPNGTSRITYRVRAVRSNAVGAAVNYAVVFGTQGVNAEMLRGCNDPVFMKAA